MISLVFQAKHMVSHSSIYSLASSRVVLSFVLLLSYLGLHGIVAQSTLLSFLSSFVFRRVILSVAA